MVFHEDAFCRLSDRIRELTLSRENLKYARLILFIMILLMSLNDVTDEACNIQATGASNSRCGAAKALRKK